MMLTMATEIRELRRHSSRKKHAQADRCKLFRVGRKIERCCSLGSYLASLELQYKVEETEARTAMTLLTGTWELH
jgi:hypothetical protein